MKQNTIYLTNPSFTAGFLKRAQENGLSQFEAENLLKEATLGEWLREFYTNRKDDINEWRANDWDWTQKARAGWRATGAQGAPWNWGGYSDHLGNIQEEETQRMAPLFQDRVVHKLMQKDEPAANLATDKFRYAMNKTQDPNFQKVQGNSFQQAITPFQVANTAAAQRARDLATSTGNINEMLSKPLIPPAVTKPTATGVGFEMPKPNMAPGLNFDVSAASPKNLL